MTTFAKLEYKSGSAERGRTIFERILSAYPRKIDVWCQYVDMETKHSEDHAFARYVGEVFRSLPAEAG